MDRKIMKTVGIGIFLMLSVLFLTVLLTRVDDWPAKLLLGGCYMGAAAVYAFSVLLGRREIYSFAEDMDMCIDQMIQGEEHIVFNETGEDLLSRLQTKLGKLYGIQKSYVGSSLEEKKKLKELISDVSHQTKTPIANIRMYTEILKEHPEDMTHQKEFVERMEEQVIKLEFLIQSMIKMSRLETGIVKIHKKAVPIFDTLGRAVGSVMPKAEKKEISVSVGGDSDLVINHDPKWTEEAVFNVLDNAVKYSEDGGSIEVNVVPQELFVRIDIRDNGKGIKESRQADIFRRFYREPEVYAQEGIGIGLYLTREILAQQGGYIEVRSEEGKGALFRLYLLNERAVYNTEC